MSKCRCLMTAEKKPMGGPKLLSRSGDSSIRCLVLSRYGIRGASSRVRFAQYFPQLASYGIECHFSPLLEDSYLLRRYAHSPLRFLDVFTGYLKRFEQLLSARQFDVIWLEGELFPGLPAAFEQLILRSGVPYVLDYDDAIFLRYEKQLGSWFGGLFRDKFSRLISGSAAVTAGNRFLENWAQKEGARRVVYIPSVIDAGRYVSTSESSGPAGRFVVGWIGSPHTARYLDIVAPALERQNRLTPLELMTIGAGPMGDYPVPVRQHEWSLAREVELIEAMDVGIMPLPSDAWSLGKCGYKLIQYMALGKPVVASAVGANLDIVAHGVNGFLAQGDDDWVRGLACLAESQALRSNFGRLGRERIQEHFTTQITAPVVASVLRSAVKGG